MKKNSSIVIGLLLLFAAVVSCQQEEEISDLNAIGDKMIINQKSQTLLDPANLNQEEIDDVSCGESYDFPIMAGQHIPVGTLRVSNSENQLFITYDLSGTDWTLKETHLYVGPESGIPYTSAGNPKVGHLSYPGDAGDDLSDPMVIDLGELEDCFVIIAHAVVENSGNGQTETAFAKPLESADDFTFDGNRWGWYIEYCAETCQADATGGTSEDDDQDEGENIGGSEDDEQDAANGGSGGGNDLTDGGQGTTGGGSGPDVVCKESFARGTMNSCFMEDGFNEWGWTNYIQGAYDADYASGMNYNFDLIANAYDCDVLAGEVIGQVEVTVRGGDGRFSADLTVYTNDNYELNDLHIYIGSDAYPTDDNGRESLDLSSFTISESGLSGNVWSMKDVAWLFNSNLIVRVNACTTRN